MYMKRTFEEDTGPPQPYCTLCIVSVVRWLYFDKYEDLKLPAALTQLHE